MIRVTEYLTRTILLICLLLVVSCNSKIYDPNYQHSGFVLALQDYVGKDFEDVRRGRAGGWGREASLKEQAEIPNGHTVYKYSHLRTCRYIFEVDSKTDKIIAVDWEGNKGDCIIVP